MTQPGIEPQSPRPLVSTLLSRPMDQLYKHEHLIFYILNIYTIVIKKKEYTNL